MPNGSMQARPASGAVAVLLTAVAVVVGLGAHPAAGRSQTTAAPGTPTGAAAVAAADAPAVDPALFAGLKWKSLGPARGGRSTAVAGSAARPLEYYFGATGGGLWKTTDGGQTWAPVADKDLRSSSVGAIAVAPSNPDVVYVGMGETQLRGNIIQGDGVYRTADGGKTWAHVGLEPTMAIARIRVHPTNPDLVFAAALGNPYGSGPDRGVYRSKDGGTTWQRVLFRDDRTGAVDLAMSPASPDVLYATLWEVFRTPHSLSSGGPGSGLFKSIDGGETWTELTANPGFPKGVWGKVGIAVSPVDSARLYAIVENAAGGVFVSDDAGATWRLASSDRKLRQRAFYYTRIYADPKARDTVYVLNVQFHKSTDGGKTYSTIRVPHGDNHDLWIAPDNPDRMVQANDGGANVTVNGGRTWTDQDIPTAQFYNVFVTGHTPYHVCGAQQDNSTACVPSGGGPMYTAGGCESGYIAPDPRDLDVFYAGCYGGMLTRFDRRTGQSRWVSVWPDNPMGHSSSQIRERFQWTFPIVFSPSDPGVLYTASQHLWRTTTEGQRWERISPDLTRADPTTMGPSGGPITLDQTGVETYATIFTVAPSRHDRDTIWTGSDDGVVHLTRDGGRSWTKVTPAALPEFARISLIEASPHRAATAYLAANRYQRGDRAPYVFRTDDYGATWTAITAGLPPTDFPRVVREDPVRPGLLYLGTEHGVHVSFDDGLRWQSLRLELPVTPVHGVAVAGDDLVIGTHGRSFWVLPGLHVLRQITPEVAAAKAWLFAPGGALRTRTPGTSGAGATIDYHLAEDADAVTIEILDPAGAVVRTLKGTAEDAKKAAAKAGDAARGAGDDDEEDDGPPPVKVPVGKGHQRVTWDLRYEGATRFPKMILWFAGTRGPLAPPGNYTVRLTALGSTRTQPLTITRDPRLSATDADLAAQFALATRVRDEVSRANGAVIRIRAMKDEIAKRGAATSDGHVRAEADALSARLTAIEGEIYQYRNQSSQDPLNYPIKLNNKIGALAGVIESAEAAPTDQARAVLNELTAQLDAQIAALDAVLAREVPAFNRTLGRARLDPVGR
jgi:photosystem II stability/assembly factor-like uncharacterized protein